MNLPMQYHHYQPRPRHSWAKKRIPNGFETISIPFIKLKWNFDESHIHIQEHSTQYTQLHIASLSARITYCIFHLHKCKSFKQRTLKFSRSAFHCLKNVNIYFTIFRHSGSFSVNFYLYSTFILVHMNSRSYKTLYTQIRHCNSTMILSSAPQDAFPLLKKFWILNIDESPLEWHKIWTTNRQLCILKRCLYFVACFDVLYYFKKIWFYFSKNEFTQLIWIKIICFDCENDWKLLIEYSKLKFCLNSMFQSID